MGRATVTASAPDPSHLDRDGLLDHLFGYLAEARGLKCGEAMRSLLHDLAVMDDDDLRSLYQELLW